MKRWIAVVGLVAVLTVLVAVPAAAAPRVGGKCSLYSGMIGIDAGYPLNDNVMLTGSLGYTPSDVGMLNLGVRYYILTEGLRPYAALSLTGYVHFSGSGPGAGIVPLLGLEYLFDNGVYVNIDGGFMFLFAGGGAPVGAVSVGYQF